MLFEKIAELSKNDKFLLILEEKGLKYLKQAFKYKLEVFMLIMDSIV